MGPGEGFPWAQGELRNGKKLTVPFCFTQAIATLYFILVLTSGFSTKTSVAL